MAVSLLYYEQVPSSRAAASMLQVMTARLPLLFDIVACERGWWIEKRGSAQSPLAAYVDYRSL